ncbi:polysaccharide pyruvyl transferase family protein [Jeotgalibacillus proteolyticus]|uniref:polysaccharide pyruvyl transferase family protein n=1 Tax=Jeotgalibacillus proteolyticus TaxID=2082395 RepID=UPI003CF801C7
MKMLMFAHDGSSNRGCEAIVRSTTTMIKDRIDGAEIYLASGKPETDKIITKLDKVYDGSLSPLRKHSFHWYVSSIKVKLFNDESYALGKVHQNIIKHINNMDIYLSIGGDNYCYGEQPGWYEIDRRVKAHGKKLVLWGCSIGEEDLSEQKLLDLKQFDLILARESITYNVLKKQGLSRVRLTADPAFTMEKNELALPGEWVVGKTMGINFSPLVLNKNRKSLEAIRDLIRHILKNSDLTIALTPHVIIDGNNDYEILSLLFEEFKHSQRVLLLPDNLTATQYKGYIARMRFFIGARTHATIAAYSSLVPTMVLGYSVKSKGIAKDLFGRERLVFGIDELSDEKKLISGFKEMLVEEKDIQSCLKRSVPMMKKLAYEAVDHLNDVMMR